MIVPNCCADNESFSTRTLGMDSKALESSEIVCDEVEGEDESIEKIQML